MRQPRTIEEAELQQRVRWVPHRGRDVLRVDFSGLIGEEGIPLLHREAEIMRTTGHKVLVLIDLTDAVANTAFMNEAKRLGKEVFMPNSQRRAMVGVTGLRAVLVSTYTRFIGAGDTQKIFGSEQEAMDWLVS
jgi:hypothetical protein